MQLKDINKNVIDIYQARNGAIYFNFGNSSCPLSKEQIKTLGIESNFYDLPDFDSAAYAEFYK